MLKCRKPRKQKTPATTDNESCEQKFLGRRQLLAVCKTPFCTLIEPTQRTWVWISLLIIIIVLWYHYRYCSSFVSKESKQERWEDAHLLHSLPAQQHPGKKQGCRRDPGQWHRNAPFYLSSHTLTCWGGKWRKEHKEYICTYGNEMNENRNKTQRNNLK